MTTRLPNVNMDPFDEDYLGLDDEVARNRTGPSAVFSVRTRYVNICKRT